MNKDWVITFTFDVDPPMETMDLWENQLAGFDGSVARIPDRGVDVTVFASGTMAMLEGAEKMLIEVSCVVGTEPIGAEILTECEWERRAEAPTMPELMSAAEIADELGVSRQRVHQLRDTAAFPAPLADLRGGAVWDAAAIRKFNVEWERRPGRPRVVNLEGQQRHSVMRQLSLPDMDFVPDLVAVDEDGQVVLMEVKGSNRREVVPNPDGGWDVRSPDAGRVIAHRETKQEAIRRAREILQKRGGGELSIRGRDGKISLSDTVRPGKKEKN